MTYQEKIDFIFDSLKMQSGFSQDANLEERENEVLTVIQNLGMSLNDAVSYLS